MERRTGKSSKIINDPVYGFINIPADFLAAVIDNQWFQRLRRIKQLGLTNYVYPGANHTRFQHSLGALHLTVSAVETLRCKGVTVSRDEEEALLLAVLLHDVGHGPFSHALEDSLFSGVTHEKLSLLFLERLSDLWPGRSELAASIFSGRYQREFFRELLSGQTDMDRLDYLRRDSFFTGVVEGSVSSDRIIKMLNVADDHLVIEEKGIYSVENFLIARRLMYWQVYMHKTVIAVERVVEAVIQRARELAEAGMPPAAPAPLTFFLERRITAIHLDSCSAAEREDILDKFALLDDSDIVVAAKSWMGHADPVLSHLCHSLTGRDLPAIELSNSPFCNDRVEALTRKAVKRYGVSERDGHYFVFTGEVSNRTYAPDDPQVNILLKDGSICTIKEVSDMFDHDSLSQKSIKYFLCYPKIFREMK